MGSLSTLGPVIQIAGPFYVFKTLLLSPETYRGSLEVMPAFKAKVAVIAIKDAKLTRLASPAAGWPKNAPE